MKREFTGADMTKVLVAGFGIVVIVNVTMASMAISGFGGVIVDNSYVASQKFNGWLQQAEHSRALDWKAQVSRDAQNRMIVEIANVPQGAIMSAELRRPLGKREHVSLTFPAADQSRVLRSNEAVGDGRWTVRLKIVSGTNVWSEEMPFS
jgi:nitrogen fixation protein FixH